MTTLHEPHLVTRTLTVTEMICSECGDAIEDGLAALDGVVNVVTDWRYDSITLTYDLTRVRLQEVENLLTELGFPPDPTLFGQLRREWLHFIEQNELDHLNAPPPNFTEPPELPHQDHRGYTLVR